MFLKILSVLFALVALLLLGGTLHNQRRGELVVRIGNYLNDAGVTQTGDPLTFLKGQMFNVSIGVVFGLAAFVFWILPTR